MCPLPGPATSYQGGPKASAVWRAVACLVRGRSFREVLRVLRGYGGPDARSRNTRDNRGRDQGSVPIVQRKEGRDYRQGTGSRYYACPECGFWHARNDPCPERSEITPGGTLTNVMTFGPCEHCGVWHRADFSCDTAKRVIQRDLEQDERKGPVMCGFCNKHHTAALTCAMVDEYNEWKSKQDRGFEAVWGATLAEAWTTAKILARMNRGIALLDMQERATRNNSGCDAGADVEDRGQRP